MYTLVTSKHVKKDLERISKQDLLKIYEAMLGLKQNPWPAGFKKLKGHADRYRLRQGDYRVIYTVNKKLNEVCVHYVRHRKNAYQ